MSLIKAQCSNCGGRLEIGKSKGTLTCPYCNTLYIIDDANSLRRYEERPSDTGISEVNQGAITKPVEHTGPFKFFSWSDIVISYVIIAITGLAAYWYTSSTTAAIILFSVFAASIGANMILINRKGRLELLGMHFWNCIFATEIFIFVIHTRQEAPKSLLLAVLFFILPIAIGFGLVLTVVSINEQDGFGAAGICAVVMLVSWLSRMLQTAPNVYKGAMWVSFAALAIIAIIAIVKSLKQDKISMLMLIVVGVSGFFILRHLLAIY